MAATMKLGANKKELKKRELVYTEKIFCRSKSNTHNLKRADRVKKEYVCGLKFTETCSVGWNVTHTIRNEQTGLKNNLNKSENAGWEMAQGQCNYTAESAQLKENSSNSAK